MGRHVLMICTSGTSAIGPFPKLQALIGERLTREQEKNPEIVAAQIKKVTSLTDEQILEAVLNSEVKDKERQNAADVIRVPEKYEDVLKAADFVGSYIFPSAEMQTILRWLSNVIKGKAEEVDEVRVVMLPTKTAASVLTAHVGIVCLNHLKALYGKIKVHCSRDSSGIIPLPIKVDTREEILPSIANLFAKLDELADGKKPGEEVIICSTGGYKAVSGFAMVYAQLHSLPCLYSFEKTSDAYELMSMPLGYAYSSLDEEINMLKAVRENAQVSKDSLPQWVKDSEFMAGTLLKSYDEAREKPYGLGEEIFRRLRNCKGGNEWADYLQNLLTLRWGELWLGDQIPETVEHSRRHSKRLMEMAANFFRCAGKSIGNIGFTDDDPLPLALLIASIYLHDIGHTALSYPPAVNNDDVNNEDLFPLGLFPSAVRELHHILTGEVLNSGSERYFMRSEYPGKADVLMKCIPLIAAHHRGYTALRRGDSASPNERIMKAGNLILGTERFSETLKPLEERAENTGINPEILLNVTALLRVLDGCDVQSDRVISRRYLEYRNQRSADEARLIQAEMMSCIRRLPERLQENVRAVFIGGNISGNEIEDYCKMIYSQVFDGLAGLKGRHGNWRNVQGCALPEFIALSLANRLAFKREQYLHFQKHQCTAFVLPVMNEEENTITVKIFRSSLIDGDITGTLEAIAHDIDREYDAVKDVLKNFPAVKAEVAGGI
ncbi:MAG: hypothetical protein IJP86_05830 [Synergistaceae bacterium]|nr:hypothetical protein [Synergistaceae bacterium]